MVTTTAPFKASANYNRYLVLWVLGLVGTFLIGLYSMAQVLLKGLQVTALTDQVPWGLWITLDLSAIALGAGAFTFSAAVYLFRIKRFQPLARPAVFVGFLGYTSAMISLAMDIGRPDRFWHPLVFWNVHSVLWEITWAVILYSTVLVLEVLPVVLESHLFDRWPWLRKLGHRIHGLTPILAVLGMGISLIHQSSLGATYGVLAGRAIWYKPSLPVMFIISAIAGGLSLTLLATIITSKLRNHEFLPNKVKWDVAQVVGYILLGYLYIKIWDWATTSYYSHTPGAVSTIERLMATTPYSSSFWWLEIVLSGLIPAIILLYQPLRRDDRSLIAGLGLVIIGVVVNRWNITLSGLVAPPAWSPGVLGNIVAVSYFPTLIEIGVALGIVSYALLAFTLGVRYLPIFTQQQVGSGDD